MSKQVTGFPATNSVGSTRSDYTLLQAIVSQIQAMNPTVIETDITVTGADGQLILGTSGSVADLKVNLPAVATNLGAVITVVKVDAGTKKVILDANASETINGATTLELGSQWAKTTIYCTATGWVVIA